MASTQSISLFSVPIGDFAYVTFDGHGEIKQMPMSSRASPVLSIARFTASPAATSTGGFKGSRCGIRFGKRTRISRTTLGHAVLISGS